MVKVWSVPGHSPVMSTEGESLWTPVPLCSAALYSITRSRRRMWLHSKGNCIRTNAEHCYLCALVFSALVFSALGPQCSGSSVLWVLSALGPQCSGSSVLWVLSALGPQCSESSVLWVLSALVFSALGPQCSGSSVLWVLSALGPQ
uniref:Uncharacterized protein n=1 Tax=Knipowitschia caucasica TaxID=637954 RepID=A0AAV2KCZ2_KNICA